MSGIQLAHADIPNLKSGVKLLPAVETALEAMGWLTDADEAIAALARVCAETIDAAGDGLEMPSMDTPVPLLIATIVQLRNDLRRKALLERVGPTLNQCMTQLYGTPAARAKMTGKGSAKSKLSILRESRTA